jgi:hypothetical protein
MVSVKLSRSFSAAWSCTPLRSLSTRSISCHRSVPFFPSFSPLSINRTSATSTAYNEAIHALNQLKEGKLAELKMVEAELQALKQQDSSHSDHFVRLEQERHRLFMQLHSSADLDAEKYLQYTNNMGTSIVLCCFLWSTSFVTFLYFF